MARIQINTDQVTEIAAELEMLNRKLTDELEASKDVFAALGNSWSGEAYESIKLPHSCCVITSDSESENMHLIQVRSYIGF